jgi:hypothetical protein
MGKLFSKDRNQKRIDSNLAKIKNPKAIRDDRVAAIDFFTHLDDVEVAVPALLQRFEYSLEHGINDTREKEACLEGIVAYGAKALPHVREHLRSTSRIAWPIKTLKALGEAEVVIDILKDALDFGDVAFDQAKVDKNYDILCYMIEYKMPGFASRLAHFLADPDERVRFAAAEVMIEQDDPVVPASLERFLGDESADNTRIRRAVIEAFVKHHWALKEPEKFPAGQVAGPVWVNDKAQLEVRS